MTVYKTAYGDLEIDTSNHMDYCDSFEMLVFGTELLQSVTVDPRQVELNRHLMKEGKIEFDEYEEVK